MPGEYYAIHICHTNKLVLCLHVLKMFHDRTPDHSLGRVVGRGRLAADAKRRPHGIAACLAITPEQDHRGRAMTGDIGPGRVDDMCEVDSQQEVLYEFLAEFSLHERVGGDQAYVPAPAILGGDGQAEESLRKGDRKRILAMARRVSISIRCIQT